MKSLIKSLCIFISIFLVASCTPEETAIKIGTIQFNFAAQVNGRQNLSSETAFVLLTIKKSNGASVHELLKLELFSFGNGYISSSIELPAGEYKITSFFILDSENDVTYACPIEGSEQAQYVTDPLPIYFEVLEDVTTTVMPQVLAITPDTDPESFGYVNFGFEIVNPGDSLHVNSIQLTLDGEFWKASQVDSAVFNPDGDWFAVMGRIFTNDTTYTHVFILIREYDFTTGKMPDNKVEIEMAINISLSSGKGDFYNSPWGTPRVNEVTITEYDPVALTISGTFSAYAYDFQGVSKRVITNGIFNKVAIMRQGLP